MDLKLTKFWENIDLPCNEDTLDMFSSQYINALNNRIIIVNDRIDDDIIEKAVLPLIAMDNDGSKRPITIVINTGGGYIGSGFALVHTIEHLKTPTVLFIIGEALSMGFYIAMAGHNNPNVKTLCTPYSRAMYHMGVIKDCDGEEALTAFQRKYDETIIYDYIISHSNITKDMLKQWADQEVYFTAKELEDFGIAEIEK